MEHSAIAATLTGVGARDDIERTSRQAMPPREYLDAAQTIRSILQVRKDILSFFNPALFSDPAWEILLHVALAEAEQRRSTVTSICDSVHAPPTTVGRWLKVMTDKRLLVRRKSPLDGRVTYVGLSPSGAASMQAYLVKAAESLQDAIK